MLLNYLCSYGLNLMFNYSLYNNRILLLLFMVVLTRIFVLYEHFMYVRADPSTPALHVDC